MIPRNVHQFYPTARAEEHKTSDQGSWGQSCCGGLTCSAVKHEDISSPRTRQNALKHGKHPLSFFRRLGNSHFITTFCVRTGQMCNLGK